MKTTENISLAGYAFTIETDAYEELGAYLGNIRACFSSDASADEIVADIEERIAELLREKCIAGMVVDLPMVLDIKKRIGDPKELASEDADASFETRDQTQEQPKQEQPKQEKKTDRKNRRLYRNMDERVLGGVCSGLGTYFGLDKVLFRIIFLIIFFISIFGSGDGPVLLFPILAYICLWIAMPAARTAEQKREMKGKPRVLDDVYRLDFP